MGERAEPAAPALLPCFSSAATVLLLCYQCAANVDMGSLGALPALFLLLVPVPAQMEKEQSLQQLLSQGSPRFQEEQESSLLRLTHPWPAVPSLAGVPGVPGVPGALGVPGVLGVAGGKGEGCGKEAREGEGSLPLSRPLKSLPWSPSAQPSSLPWLGLGGEGSGSEEREGGGSNLALPRPLGPLPWTPEEDAELLAFVETYGARHWRRVPKMTRLPRDPQTCRLRWLNHLCFQVRPSPLVWVTSCATLSLCLLPRPPSLSLYTWTMLRGALMEH